MNMKTIKDLQFKEHPLRINNCQRAIMYFNNNYGVSVLLGTLFYSNGIDTYEVAVLYDGEISYNTDITDDVLGYQTAEEVTEIMKRVQQLK